MLMSIPSHPVDHLIAELLETDRDASPDDVRRIIERMATAPFDSRLTRVPISDRGLAYQGHVVAARETSLVVHLVRRVLLDRQWAEGTTAEQYVTDLRRAVRSQHTSLAVYGRRGGRLAATLTRTVQAVPASQRGPDWLPELLVVYSADRGMIVTGYQVSGRQVIHIPEGARWLQ